MVSVKEKALNAPTAKGSIKAMRSGDLKTAIPKSAIPKSAIPKSAVPKSAVPKSAVPKSSVPKTAVPKSAVPKSVVTKSADRKPRARDAVATEAVASKKKNVKVSIKKQKKGTISSTEKTATGCGEDDDATCYLSSDGFLWCSKEPDLKIIEPRILVTANFNYLEFSRKADRPPERRIIHLVNHGDQPIAFKVNTTDNYSYIIDRWVGVIPPRQTCVNAAIRMPNVAVIQAEDQAKFYNSPHKDKMFVLLAPQLCQTFAPEAIFHNERCYEKLRIMLRYTGIEETPGDTRPKQLLLHGVPGWMSWKEDNVVQKQKNARQMAEFRKIEMNINLNASKEQLEEISKTAMRTRQPSPAPTARARTPLSYGKRPGFGMLRKQKKSFSPFERTPKMKTAEPSETPKKTQSTIDGQTSAVAILSKKSIKNEVPVEKSLKASVAPSTDVNKMEKNEKNVAAPKEGDTPSTKQIKKTPEKSVKPLPKEEVGEGEQHKKSDLRSPLATLTVPVRKASDKAASSLTVDSATSTVTPSPSVAPSSSVVPTSSLAPTSSVVPTSSLAAISGRRGRSSAETTNSKLRPVEKEEEHHDKSPKN